MGKQLRKVNPVFYLGLALLASHYTTAQLVATKDLTKIPNVPLSTARTPPEPSSPTSTSDSTDEDKCFFEISDGAIVREVPEKLQLEVVNAEPRLVYNGTKMTVTVRLKNIGDLPALVPWEVQPIEPDTDPKTGKTSYESASIHLTFATLEDRRNGSYLKGAVTLVAAPSNRAQHIELLSGQWLAVKFEASIECSSTEAWACTPFHADEHARLTAHWGEWLNTHEEQGCNTWRGAYKSRTLESEALEVVYVALPPSDEHQAAPQR